MIQLFRITNDPDAPRLRLANPSLYKDSFMRFEGEQKGPYSPDRAFDVIADPCENVLQFYNSAPGVLAGPVDGLCECSDMLYATGGTERLMLEAGDVPFTAINPIDPFPPLQMGSVPFPKGWFAPVFRIQDQNPLDLICISDAVVPMDEFKNVYDHYGFKGLMFEEIWR